MRGRFRDDVSREQIRGIHHGLELQAVPARILEKHGPLLARRADESEVRLDHELDALVLEFGGQLMESRDRQTNAKVWNWYVAVCWLVFTRLLRVSKNSKLTYSRSTGL